MTKASAGAPESADRQVCDPAIGRSRRYARGLPADLLGCLLVLLGNPVLYRLGTGVLDATSPDASLYASLGRVMANDGTLYLRSWGTVDQGVILPPLLPALIAFGSLWSDDLLRVGAWISGLAALAAGIALYALVSRLTNRVTAVVAVVAAQLGRDIFFYAFAPLTESLFTAVTALTLVLLWRFGEKPNAARGISLGVACALALLTRKPGIFVVSGVCIWIALVALWERRFELRSIARSGAWVGAGCCLVFGPYSAAVYAQTAQHPLQPRFRLGEYVVGTDDPDVIAEIAQINEETEEADYQSIYRSRRLLRKLLPDGSEMYGALWPPPAGASTSEPVLQRVFADAVSEPTAILGRLARNSRHLQEVLGWPLFALFLATSLSPLLNRLIEPIPASRFLLPTITWAYLVGISVVTDLISRYVVVLAPFAVAQCTAEVYALAARVFPRGATATLLCITLVTGGVAAMPRNFTSVRFDPGYDRWVAPYAVLRKHVTPGEPVFAAAPLDALLLGAGFRALPNSSLQQLVSYGRRTGVRWVVLTNLAHDRKQYEMYDDDWYLLPGVQRDAAVAGWLERRAEARNGRYVLYQIRGHWPGRRPLRQEARP